VALNPGSEIGPKTLITRKRPTANDGQGTDLYLTRHGFRTAFAGDEPTTLADQMWAEQRPFSEEAFASSSGEPAWKTIRSWYLVATQDRARYLVGRTPASCRPTRSRALKARVRVSGPARLIRAGKLAIARSGGHGNQLLNADPGQALTGAGTSTRCTRSTSRLEYPHSLSYQAMTLTCVPSTTAVRPASKIAEYGDLTMSEETSGSSL
jgi:hypothetical protein